MSLAPLLLLTSLAVGGTTSPTMRAQRVAGGIQIDGDLSEAAWLQATPAREFRQRSPNDGSIPENQTEVRILYDDDALYFGFSCADSEPGRIVANLTRRDGDAGSDGMVIDLDTEGDHARAFHFEVSAAGVQRDGIRTGDYAIAWEWNAVWRSAARIGPRGWSAEVAIPFSVLRTSKPTQPDFRVQFRRVIARRDEWQMWVYYPRTEQGEMQRYGRILGLENLPVSRGIVLEPFVTGRVRSRRAPADLGLETGVDGRFGAGLDARFGLTPGLTLSTTILPDFGQVEADPATLNLSRFELRLTERRPFFLENADLFSLSDAWGNALSTQLFYSRRLGATPPDAALPGGATVRSSPEGTRIWGAAKLTGRIGSRLTVALLEGLTADENAELRLRDGSIVKEQVRPLSNYLVGRLQAPLGGGLTAGVTATNVLRREGANRLGREGVCPGDIAPGADGRCTNDALALSADLKWRSDNGGWVATGAVYGSQLRDGPVRTYSDGNVNRPGDVGFGGRVELLKSSGHLLGGLVYDAAGAKLDLNDAGYLRGQNFHVLYSRLGWRVLNSGRIQSSTTSVESWLTNSWDGVATGRYAQVAHSTTWTNLWGIGGNVGRSFPTYDNRDVGDGTLTQRPATVNAGLWGNTNTTKSFSMGFWSWIQSTWRSGGGGFGSWVNARPGTRVNLSLDAWCSVNDGDPRYVASSGAGGERRITMGLQRSTSASTTFRSTFTFTPTMTLQTYTQLFFSSVHYTELLSASLSGARPTVLLDALGPAAGEATAYDSRNAVLNLNVLFRWEYRPGSVLSVVYTRAHRGGDVPMPLSQNGVPLQAQSFDWKALSRSPVEDAFLAKISYYWGG
jgi:hypothetical protein